MARSCQIQPIALEDCATEVGLNSIKSMRAGSPNADGDALLPVAKYKNDHICFFENSGILKEAPFFPIIQRSGLHLNG